MNPPNSTSDGPMFCKNNTMGGYLRKPKISSLFSPFIFDKKKLKEVKRLSFTVPKTTRRPGQRFGSPGLRQAASKFTVWT